jgi:hypothetical protein
MLTAYTQASTPNEMLSDLSKIYILQPIQQAFIEHIQDEFPDASLFSCFILGRLLLVSVSINLLTFRKG